LTKKELTWAFDLTKNAMEQVYDDSGYGWDDEDKEKELKEDGARFLIVRDEASNEPVAFCHFRFTVQGEVMQQMTGTTCLYVWDIQVEEEFQRKGLGGHLLKVLELIAFQQRMKFVSVPVQVACTSGISFITKVKGYGPDAYLSDVLQFSAEDEGFQVYSKELGTGKTKAAVAASAVPATAAVANAAPAPAPVAAKKVDNNVFGFGAAATTPLKTKTPVMESSPTSIAVADEEVNLGDAMDRLAVN
jgi:GNAT superfamily N-acetyltransferase